MKASGITARFATSFNSGDTPARRRRARGLLWLTGIVLMAAGCGGGGSGGGDGGFGGNELSGPPAPTLPSPVELEFRSRDLGVPAAPDGKDYRTAEFRRHHGLAAISADKAYERGYFGQGVTIAIADDGMDTTHPELASRIRDPLHVISGSNRVVEIDYRDPAGRDRGTGHGTYVAMIAAGARDNGPGPFEITVESAAPIPTPDFHGVAPEASIVPIALHGGGQPIAAMRHAVANGARAVNFSIGYVQNYYGEYAGRDGVWLTWGLPLFSPLYNGRQIREMADAANVVGNSDTIMVWGAANNGWNSVNNQIRMCGKNHRDEDQCKLGEGPVSAQEFMKNFTWIRDPDNPDDRISFSDMWGEDCGRDDCADYNTGGFWLDAPRFQPRLLGKWLVVGALTRNGNEIADFSNGCGAARNWCLMAPGVDITVGPDGRGISGTSFAAPFATGALAVLKSRWPTMPMEVVQAVLLTSADPMGSRIGNPREPDPVYGWGRLNLGRAITTQGSVHLPYSVPGSDITQAAPLRDARITLSPTLAQVSERLQDVEVAVGGVGDAYYNANLFDAAGVESWNLPTVGRAAGDMLMPASGHHTQHSGLGAHRMFVGFDPEAGELHSVGMDWSGDMLGRWRFSHRLCDDCGDATWREWNAVETAATAAAPFFTRDRSRGAVALQMQGEGVRPFIAAGNGWASSQAPWRQFGLRWRHRHGGVSSVAEFSHVDESRTVWGARFGALGATRTETLQSRLLFSAPLRGNWRGFVGYERSEGAVSARGGMLSGISGLRAEGWSAGTQGRSVFRNDDLIRFSVRQEAGVRRGEARIDHLVATGGSFVDAFYRGTPQTLERRRTVVDLRARPTTHYALGYGLSIGRSARLAVALEYEGESRERGVSTRLRVDFR
ncbi:MAG: S8 family serine peptidase [Thiotrichales bacterium]|nr:S8 family serine peptidase [Thiotrichales bacterium]